MKNTNIDIQEPLQSMCMHNIKNYKNNESILEEEMKRKGCHGHNHSPNNYYNKDDNEVNNKGKRMNGGENENEMNQDEKCLSGFEMGNEMEEQDFLEDEEEMQHLRNIVCSYFNYRVDSMKEVARMERGFENIGDNKKYLKFDFQARLGRLRDAIQNNGNLLDMMAASYRNIAFRRDNDSGKEYIPQENVHWKDVSKLRSTLKQIVRDWSEEGKVERDLCYKPIWEEFRRHFPNNRDSENKRVRVLFPGCGLGRIVFDFACEGYGAQGNEFSYHMLFASNFLLNNVTRAKQFRIQPYIFSFCNTFEEDDPLRVYEIPDVNPSDLLDPEKNDDFSMAAGEFVQIYSKQHEEWHSVCTVFFIDTANDIVEYVKTIHNCLKPGGVWINLGPLLYHYAESLSQPSIELSWQELQHVITQIGFKLTIHPQVQTNYAADPHPTMMKIQYNCIFFTAIKI